jgi:hypothetical protein
MPGFLPASMAPLIRWAVPLTASDTSAMVDFGSGAGSRPSWIKGGDSSLIILSSRMWQCGIPIDWQVAALKVAGTAIQ